MIGDLPDIVSRLRSVLPRQWFAEDSPNLQSVLTSIATPWTWLFSLISYVIQQARLSTAAGKWLDVIAFDFFGSTLSRKSREPDTAFRRRIQMALVRESATRAAVSNCLEDLVGTKPVIFEPANCGDTGCYGSLASARTPGFAGLAYGNAGGWGSLNLPSQFFIAVTRPPTPGVGMLAGYHTPPGGYGSGAISYVDLSLLPGQVTDKDIQNTLCSLLPINTVAWLRIK